MVKDPQLRFGKFGKNPILVFYPENTISAIKHGGGSIRLRV